MRHSTPLCYGFICLLIFSSAATAQKSKNKGMTINTEASQNFAFEQLTIEHGLPHNAVRCILQDSHGFLWFGTADGLARYDGYQFNIYRHDIADSTSISNNKILAICEDRFENLWIGTYNGLNKLDRSTETFARYSQGPEDNVGMKAHEVWAIRESRQTGNLWIGYWAGDWLLWGGLYKLSPQTGAFTPYRYDPYNSNTISHNAVRFVVEDDAGNLWVGTETEGLNKFDPKTEDFVRYRHDPKDPHSLGDNRVWDGLKDRDGNLWFATMGGGLNKYDSKLDGFVRYVPEPDHSAGPYIMDVCRIYQDSQGMIWLSNGVLSRFDPTTASFTHFRFSPNQNDWLSNYHPFAIQEDNTGNLWVGTRGSGVFKIDLKPQRFTHYRHVPGHPNSLSDDDIRLIYEDSKGAIWNATRDHGLSRLDPQTGQITNFKHEERNARSLSSDVVYALCEDRSGNIWAGTQKGLNRFDPQQQFFMRYDYDAANLHCLSHEAINSVFVDSKDTLWIGFAGNGGIGKFDWRAEILRRYNPVPVNKGHYYVDHFFEDRQGNLWIGAEQQQFLFDRRTGQCQLIKQKWRSFGAARRLLQDQNGTVWGWWRSFYKLNPNDLTSTHFFLLNPPDVWTNTGFMAFYNQVQFAYVDDKNKIWCGTLHGLYRFDPLAEQVTARYYGKDGLPSDLITKIAADDAGRLWLLTGAGISIFDETAPQGAQFTNLGPDDGVINTPSSPEAFIRTGNGEIYWGGSNGVYRFYPQVQSTNPHSPQIRLTDFKLFNRSVALDTAISEINTIHLDYDENFFSFTFAAMDFTNPRQNHYAYQLDGFDQDWVQIGNRHTANYTQVPPGTYTFRVKGSNNNGVWNEEGASVKVIITPPFWAIWWFRSASVLTVCLVLFVLYRYRVHRLLELQLTRLRIAQDLHDDIGSSLSSIALESELVQGRTALDEKEKTRLNRIANRSRQLIESMDDIVWAINPANDRLDDLLQRMRSTVVDLFAPKGISCTFHFPQKVLPHTLAMEFRRNLFLIYKELLNNVFKHSLATHVEIDLEKQNGMLILKVKDNGVGFDAAAARNGNGLSNMKMRAMKLNGKIEFQHPPEGGVEAVLTVKIP